MKTALFGAIISCIAITAFSSCEALFSTSALSWAQRDPSSLSQEQKVTYAQDALASGDQSSMKKAFDSLKTTSDSSLKPLVAELAFGAAGVTQAMTDIMGDLINNTSEAQVESAITKLLTGFSADDVALIATGSTLVDAAAAGGVALTANQYLVAGVGMLVKAAKDNGNNISSISTAGGTPGGAAINYLLNARNLMGPGSQAYSILDSFQSYFVNYAIGDIGPAGGLIFYDKGSFSNGWRYLEAAPVNQNSGNTEWNNVASITPGLSGAVAVGTGQANTAFIAAFYGAGTYAAKLCDDLVLGGKSDWFLPSKNELALMYTNLKMAGLGGFSSAGYWSSSEDTAGAAWAQNFGTGASFSYVKNNTIYVRAVRAF